MSQDQDCLAERRRIEESIARPVQEVLSRELGPGACRRLLALARSQAVLDPATPFPLPVTILAQRRIEGQLIRHFHLAIAQELGPGEADRLIGLAVESDATAAGRRQAALAGGRADLATFAGILPLWARGGALEIEILESGPGVLSYDVTRCQYAEMYREMGLASLGFLLSCGRDEAFMKGYAPGVALKREGTIMSGDPVCDFRYRLQPQDA
ncbi:MAG: L-2-amino-thiazoline-4-carboxylic acid hydrolase [Deltaproteobacteria bacterium]|jgi:hypothetical protein|nr:L-2-amino-thiazoline-4-carboxylic acid hydrolase [Deltaproteobacteria bacterium]